MKNLTTGFFVIVMLIFVGLGCSNSDTKTAENTTVNTGSTDNKSNSNTSANSQKPSSDDDVAGNYSVTGKNLSDQSYQGDLTVKKQGDVYQFSWTAGGSSYDGVGVRDGNLVAVGYGAGTDGKGCGAAIYKIGENSLSGKLGGWGYNQVGTQTAVLLKQNKDGGVFAVTGTDTDGSGYKGELYVAESKSDVYHFAFSGGKVQYIGTGIKVGDHFGAGMGVKQCGYVVYEVKSDRLEAAWGVIGNDKLGTEIATRK